MPKFTVSQILEAALKHSQNLPNETLGECLRVLELDNSHITSLMNMAYEEIENQYYEDAPNGQTQKFLDQIQFIENNYSKYR